MKKERLIIGMFSLIVILILGACGSSKTSEEKAANNEASNTNNEEVLKIYTTLYPIEYFVEQIGADYVKVESILPLGADAHTYEPTSKTMVDIAEADAFIYNGADMESYAATIEEALEAEGVSILEAAKDVALLDHVHDHEDEEASHDHNENPEQTAEGNHDHGDKDPHVWLDPIRCISLAENIKDLLVELMPEAREEFEANFSDLQTKLEKLDRDFHEKLEQTPRNEVLVTHAAYGYWEEAYGIEQLAISGLSSSNEPSQKQLEQVIDTVKEHHIRYLLFEQNVEPKVASVIQDETGVDSLYIHNLSTLTEEDVKNDEDYFTLMNRNLDTLIEALRE
ncbi:metal ABC transporter solute-binding protein, Zn/Mn family [Paraliobacillus sp. JSM ZJ581]|uniref:metal ABC transporter solute-binding protein, Zn/Mn family n=1 Tax=Paraliobacillus sp. JSM ZJ581 TaxID=3342118 RepID=UPI0035A848AD